MQVRKWSSETVSMVTQLSRKFRPLRFPSWSSLIDLELEAILWPFILLLGFGTQLVSSPAATLLPVIRLTSRSTDLGLAACFRMLNLAARRKRPTFCSPQDSADQHLGFEKSVKGWNSCQKTKTKTKQNKKKTTKNRAGCSRGWISQALAPTQYKIFSFNSA